MKPVMIGSDLPPPQVLLPCAQQRGLSLMHSRQHSLKRARVLCMCSTSELASSPRVHSWARQSCGMAEHHPGCPANTSLLQAADVFANEI